MIETVVNILKDNKQRLKPLGFFALTVIGLYGLSQIFKVNEQQHQQQQNQKGKRPVGIMNQGNTCFVNSLLQALSSVETFRKNIESLLKVKVPKDDNEELIIELNKVIKKINTGSSSISVMDLLDILSRTQEGLINYEQQDTFELYSAIVKGYDEFFNKRKQSNLSVSQLNLKQENLVNCLIGYAKSTIECMTCKNTMTIKLQSFYDLSLQIAPNFVYNIKSALMWFERKQKIDCYACNFCSVKTHIQKLCSAKQRLKGNRWQAELTVVCQKLIIFLRRFSFDDMDLKQINRTLQNEVTQFKEIFETIGDNDFRNQIFSMVKPVQRSITKQTKITKYPSFLVIHFKQLIINPYTGEPTYMKKPIDFDLTLEVQQKTHTKIYKLTSLLTHIGNESMGHYFTFRKPTKDSNEWFLISDTHTQRVTAQKMRKYVPYMLFYELDQQNYDKDQLAKSLKQNQMQDLQENIDAIENRLDRQTCSDLAQYSQKPKKVDLKKQESSEFIN